jgi:hypothetical protein
MTSYHPAAIPDLLQLPFTPHHIIPTSPPYLLAPHLPSSPSLYNLHVPIPSVPLSILHHTTAPTLDSNIDPLVAYIHRFTALADSHGNRAARTRHHLSDAQRLLLHVVETGMLVETRSFIVQDVFFAQGSFLAQGMLGAPVKLVV